MRIFRASQRTPWLAGHAVGGLGFGLAGDLEGKRQVVACVTRAAMLGTRSTTRDGGPSCARSGAGATSTTWRQSAASAAGRWRQVGSVAGWRRGGATAQAFFDNVLYKQGHIVFASGRGARGSSPSPTWTAKCCASTASPSTPSSAAGAWRCDRLRPRHRSCPRILRAACAPARRGPTRGGGQTGRGPRAARGMR